jgi:hypothetical protein
MAGRPVTVGAMRLDPAFTRIDHRVRYRITLTCGCTWWEDYAVDAVPSRVGDPAVCHEPTHAGAGVSTFASTGWAAAKRP